MTLWLVVSATLGVNAAFGLTPTLASFLHISASQIVVVPALSPPSAGSQQPLYLSWNPPVDMPAQGVTGVIAGGIIAKALEVFAHKNKGPAPIVVVVDQLSKPINIMATQKYTDSVAIFTTGELDSKYGPGQEAVSRAATAAGMEVTFRRLAGVAHNNTSFTIGLPVGFDVLYPRMGLSAPINK